MIPATELRIGSVVWQSYGGYYRVMGLRTRKDGSPWDAELQHVRGGAIGAYSFEALAPIPLTPEILEKCNCTQGDDTEMWRSPQGVWLTKVNGKEEFFVQGFRSGHRIKYLHQYQNAVFALTGEELPVNL